MGLPRDHVYDGEDDGEDDSVWWVTRDDVHDGGTRVEVVGGVNHQVPASTHTMSSHTQHDEALPCGLHGVCHVCLVRRCVYVCARVCARVCVRALRARGG